MTGRKYIFLSRFLILTKNKQKNSPVPNFAQNWAKFAFLTNRPIFFVETLLRDGFHRPIFFDYVFSSSMWTFPGKLLLATFFKATIYTIILHETSVLHRIHIRYMLTLIHVALLFSADCWIRSTATPDVEPKFLLHIRWISRDLHM